MIRRLAFVVLLISALAMNASLRADAPDLKSLEDYIQKAVGDWEVPGLAIAIVRNDEIILAKGYGVRTLSFPYPVNEETLFAIGSASKAFTCAVLATLADEGKLSWDDRAAELYPGFELFDPYATREITLRDLVCHRSGLSRGDMLWYGTSFSRDEILRRVRHLEPTWSFRGNFGYQNIMYLAAGEIAAKVGGRSWDELVEERLFEPLEMHASVTSVVPLAERENVAMPHVKVEDKVQLVRYRNIDNIGPAGSINSNVLEMANWIRMHLGRGEFEGKRIISEKMIEEMHTPQMLMPPSEINKRMYPDSHFLTYGLGWFIRDYRGEKLIQHGGNIDGMSALVGMIPEKNIGCVILTNHGGSPLPTIAMMKTFDVLLGAPDKDWSAEFKEWVAKQEKEANEREKKEEAERATNSKPSLDLANYAGAYRHEMYGDLRIDSGEGGLLFDRGAAFTGTLEHWHYDTFRVNYRNPALGKGKITFNLGADGKIKSVTIGDLGDFKRHEERSE